MSLTIPLDNLSPEQQSFADRIHATHSHMCPLAESVFLYVIEDRLTLRYLVNVDGFVLESRTFRREIAA